jgi:hypothetical protein
MVLWHDPTLTSTLSSGIRGHSLAFFVSACEHCSLPVVLWSHECICVCCQDKLDTIRLLVIGVSAHQKLELLERLVTQLGYDSLTVFGDCFDEVSKGSSGLLTFARFFYHYRGGGVLPSSHLMRGLLRILTAVFSP